jgi:hypothetical protein
LEAAAVVTNPGHTDPSAGSFRAYTSAAGALPADGDITERLNTNRSTPSQRVISRQTIDQRNRDQPARAQRTRRTVDLPAPTHRALDIWQREAADRLGVARVTGQEVLTALIDQLLADPKLSDQITRAIQARR